MAAMKADGGLCLHVIVTRLASTLHMHAGQTLQAELLIALHHCFP